MEEMKLGSSLMLKPAVVGEKQQSFAIPVQASGRIDAFDGDVSLESVALAGKLAKDSEGFMKEDVAVWQAIQTTGTRIAL